MKLEIGVDDPRRDDVRRLLATHLAFARGVTPAEYSFALEVDELVDSSVIFFSARDAERLVGVAALKRLDASHAELKSMHTAQADRGKGVGQAMVVHILEYARSVGYERVSLETGATSEFAPARALYARAGFEPCRPFADYAASPYNTFMTMTLDPRV